MTSPRRRLTALLGSVVAVAAFAAPVAAQDASSTTTTTPETTTTTTAPPPPAPVVLNHLPLSGPVLGEGAKGSEVFLMQITLTARGFWLQDLPGNFGASTRHALVAFQKYSGLPRNGKLDALTRFVLGATLDRAVPKVPKAGRSIEVDIARQILTVSEAGRTVWVLDVSTGKKSTPTPRGSFVIQRQINGQRVSNLGQLWRPKYFTGGYALHGSPSVPATPASHGCVRLTNQEINFLWDSGLAPIGTPVTLF